MVRNSISLARAEAAADAAVHRGLLDLFRADDRRSAGSATALAHEWTFDGIAGARRAERRVC